MTTKAEKPTTEPPVRVPCGVIMPLSEIDGCSADHWEEVLEIIKEGLIKTTFDVGVVSDANESGIIHQRIIDRLAEDPIVICDVSAKNPNVMFELGLRLAFDKATVVIKDDKTNYSFDTSPIEHLSYPRDLHHQKIQKFQEKLAKKVIDTFKASENPNYSTFLKAFRKLTSKKSLPTEEIAIPQALIEQLNIIREEIGALRQQRSNYPTDEMEKEYYYFGFRGASETLDRFQEAIDASSHPLPRGFLINRMDPEWLLVETSTDNHPYIARLRTLGDHFKLNYFRGMSP